ncbi:MAG: ATP-dependent helicase HrpB [Paraglaciecola sp.]
MLPVVQILPALIQQLSLGNAILVAPPGAGKSTCLPLKLIESTVFTGQKIIMLQPRRIAVRSIAGYLAEQLGEAVGQTVGYRIRGESKVSANTKLEIVTEGILTRMLQSQADLPGIGLVIFDEFHERSIHADFSLALCLEVQQALRENLRLLVMSATLDVNSLQPLMPDAKLLQCTGRSYPVNIIYQGDNTQGHLYQKVCRLILAVIHQHTQDTLVFLPGASDIRQTASSLKQKLPEGFKIHCLFGELAKSEQQAALQPDSEGLRKIILATNIAETSLTIEGIDVVIDSGMQKIATFQLSKGVTHLQTQRISQSSAIQRAGRAGRLGPGTCYRLWSAEQQDRLAKHNTSEILLSDMAAFILEAAVWGSTLNELALIDPPTKAQLEQGLQTLQALQVIDLDERLTVHGRAVHALSCHPSIANMLLSSKTISPAHASLACAVAALLESKDPLGYQHGVQLYSRLQYLQQHKSDSIWQLVRQWHKRMNCSLQDWPLEDVGVLLAFAFPQWIARLRHAGRYLLANGSGAQLAEDDPLAQQQWIVAANMLSTDMQQGDVRIRLAESLSKQNIEHYFSHLLYPYDVCHWDSQRQAIVAEKQHKLGEILWSTEPALKPSIEAINKIWQGVILKKGVMQLPFDEHALQLIYRLRLASTVLNEYNWPDMSVLGLESSMEQWLLPYMTKCRTWKQLVKLNFTEILTSRLGWQSQQRLNKLLPLKLKVPSGSQIKLTYNPDGMVQLSVRMQEVYGLADTPTLANGKLKVQMALLSPAGRALQTTQDLAGFWHSSYKSVQKEMKGRYQRHFWPDDPANAIATSKTKKKMNTE